MVVLRNDHMSFVIVRTRKPLLSDTIFLSIRAQAALQCQRSILREQAIMDDRPPKKTVSIEVRLAPKAKKDFMEICDKRKYSASAVIRNFIDTYIADANRAPNQPLWKEFNMTNIMKDMRVRLAIISGFLAIGFAIAIPSAAADARLEAVFEWLDANHDKSLTEQEFVSVERTRHAKFEGIMIVVETKGEIPAGESRSDLFSRLDQNQDRKLSLRELDRRVVVETVLKESILNADQNGDKKVTEAELAAHITARRAAVGEADPAAGAALMAHGIISAHDGDKDAAVSSEDFD
jgi:hypothetical protein